MADRPRFMTAYAFPFAGLVTAPRAGPSDTSRLLDLARMVTDAGASPVIIAAPPDVELGSVRVVRTRSGGTSIAAIRLGMAQLTNTVARAVLLLPHEAEGPTLTALLALLDAGKRSEGVLTAFAGTPLDRSPLLVPRDAWLELVTLGEGGMEAVAARHRVVRVELASS
jgi:hypothetical protein